MRTRMHASLKIGALTAGLRGGPQITKVGLAPFALGYRPGSQPHSKFEVCSFILYIDIQGVPKL